MDSRGLVMKMAMKWRIGTAAAVLKRKITLPNKKRTFVVYTTDERRFEVPLEFLNNNIFRELFRMAEDEFGVEGRRGRIILTCDAAFMKYIVSLVGRNISKDLEKALLISISDGSCTGASSSIRRSIELSRTQTLRRSLN